MGGLWDGDGDGPSPANSLLLAFLTRIADDVRCWAAVLYSSETTYDLVATLPSNTPINSNSIILQRHPG